MEIVASLCKTVTLELFFLLFFNTLYFGMEIVASFSISFFNSLYFGMEIVAFSCKTVTAQLFFLAWFSVHPEQQWKAISTDYSVLAISTHKS